MVCVWRRWATRRLECTALSVWHKMYDTERMTHRTLGMLRLVLLDLHLQREVRIRLRLLRLPATGKQDQAQGKRAPQIR